MPSYNIIYKFSIIKRTIDTTVSIDEDDSDGNDDVTTSIIFHGSKPAACNLERTLYYINITVDIFISHQLQIYSISRRVLGESTKSRQSPRPPNICLLPACINYV